MDQAGVMLNSLPRKQRINPADFISSRELRFQDRRDFQHPLLVRLYSDFNFSVLQLQRSVYSHLSRKLVPGPLEFVLALRDEHCNEWYGISPATENLEQLNTYCKTHEVDLLHLQLFGEDSDDKNPVGEALY